MQQNTEAQSPTETPVIPHGIFSGMRLFLIVWIGQVLSAIGSGLTSFALGVWVFQTTGSATQFALINLFIVLPTVIMTPFAGVLVDRWNRRTAMLFSDTGAAVSTLVIAALLLADQIQVWHIYLILGVRSLFVAFQWPAYSAAVTLLVPKHQLGRASGLVQIGGAASMLVSPVLGGLLFLTVDLWGVILIDVVSFLFSVFTLMLVRIPDPEPSTTDPSSSDSLLKDALYGWRYVTAHPGLVGLLLFVGITNFMLGMVQVLVTPLALTLTSPEQVGLILGLGGSGMVFGSIVMSVWGGPKRRVLGVLVFTLVQGVLLLLASLPPTTTLLTGVIFAFLFCNPITMGSSQVIWQSKVPPSVQGRVFAVRLMIAWGALPLAFLVAGPLVEYVFEPLLAEGGLLAGNIGSMMGTGPGAGIRLLFTVMGVLTILAFIGGYSYDRLRLLEDEIPDAIPDAAASTGIAGATTHAF